MITLSVVDLVLIAVYFGMVVGIGFFSVRRRKQSDTVDFLLAGRSLTLPLFVMTLVSTWYGGILGVGEFSYRYGISNWVVQGFPYYVFAVVFAFTLAKRIRASNLLTIPDKLQDVYGRGPALFGAGLTFVLMTPAPYILMLAVLLQMVTGWTPLLCILLGTFVTTVYLAFGGFRSDVYTDVFEFVLMFLGFAIILPFAYDKFGGWEFIRTHVPPLHLTWNGGNSIQFVVVWFFIALWTLVDPSFHQRCYAARSGKVAQKGILLSIIFWFIFDAMTATAGLYSRAVLPHLPEPMMAFPMLAEVTLPPVAKGLFTIGMLATIMSSLNTLAFISATTVGRDIVWRLRRETDENRVNGYTRWGLVITALLAVVLCVAVPSVIGLWYMIGTVIVPGLLVPLVTGYFQRLTTPPAFAFGSMVGGWLTSTVWLLVGWSAQMGATDSFPLGIEPMFPGIVVSLCVWGIGILRRP